MPSGDEAVTLPFPCHSDRRGDWGTALQGLFGQEALSRVAHSHCRLQGHGVSRSTPRSHASCRRAPLGLPEGSEKHGHTPDHEEDAMSCSTRSQVHARPQQQAAGGEEGSAWPKGQVGPWARCTQAASGRRGLATRRRASPR